MNNVTNGVSSASPLLSSPQSTEQPLSSLTQRVDNTTSSILHNNVEYMIPSISVPQNQQLSSTCLRPTTSTKAQNISTINESNPKGREMSSYTFLADDGELYEISYGVKTANGSIQKCIAPESLWKAHADQLKQARGLLEPGIEKNITIKKDDSDNKFKLYSNNNQLAEVVTDSDLYKTYFAIPQYGKRESINERPDISSTDRLSSNPASSTSTSQTFTVEKSEKIIKAANSLIDSCNAEFEGTPGEYDGIVRQARKLIHQMDRIDQTVVENLIAAKKGNDDWEVSDNEISGYINDIKLNLSQIVNDYTDFLQENFTNPNEIEAIPMGITQPSDSKNIENNCPFAATVQLYANNKLLSEACNKLLPLNSESHPMVKTLNEYAKAQKNPTTPLNGVNLQHLRPILKQSAQANTQEDASEFIFKLHEQMDLSNSKIKHLENNFTITESKYTKNGELESWTPENNGKNISPIFKSIFDSKEISEVGVPSLEGSLGTSFSSVQSPTKRGMLKIDGKPPATILIYTDRLDKNNTIKTPMDVPLYCQPAELFGAKTFDSDPNKTAPIYTLQGFISHDLKAKDSGHYVTYLQHKGRFYLLNGKIVNEINRENYLLAASTASVKNYSIVVPKETEKSSQNSQKSEKLPDNAHSSPALMGSRYSDNISFSSQPKELKDSNLKQQPLLDEKTTLSSKPTNPSPIVRQSITSKIAPLNNKTKDSSSFFNDSNSKENPSSEQNNAKISPNVILPTNTDKPLKKNVDPSAKSEQNLEPKKSSRINPPKSSKSTSSSNAPYSTRVASNLVSEDHIEGLDNNYSEYPALADKSPSNSNTGLPSGTDDKKPLRQSEQISDSNSRQTLLSGFTIKAASLVGKVIKPKNPNIIAVLQNKPFSESEDDNSGPLTNPESEESQSSPIPPSSKSGISSLQDLLNEPNNSKSLVPNPNSSLPSLTTPSLKEIGHLDNTTEKNPSPVSKTTKKNPSFWEGFFVNKSPKNNNRGQEIVNNPATKKFASNKITHDNNNDDL
jgi:hypothetical protein